MVKVTKLSRKTQEGGAIPDNELELWSALWPNSTNSELISSIQASTVDVTQIRRELVGHLNELKYANAIKNYSCIHGLKNSSDENARLYLLVLAAAVSSNFDFFNIDSVPDKPKAYFNVLDFVSDLLRTPMNYHGLTSNEKLFIAQGILGKTPYQDVDLRTLVRIIELFSNIETMPKAVVEKAKLMQDENNYTDENGEIKTYLQNEVNIALRIISSTPTPGISLTQDMFINMANSVGPLVFQRGGAPRHPPRRQTSFASSASSVSSESSSSSLSDDSSSEAASVRSDSSASTTELLGNDPLFLVLSQYFMTSTSGKSIADVLEEISVSIEKGVKQMRKLRRKLQ
jgi:hypothetical protein